MTSTNTASHYHTIFGDVCSTRFQRLSRFIFTTSWGLTILISLPSSQRWWNTLLPLRTLPIAFGLFLLACLRKNNLHIDYLGYKTLSNQLVGQIFNRKALIASLVYLSSSFLFFIVFHQQFTDLSLKAIAKKHQYPPLNDKFVYYYFYSAFISISYALQYVVFDRDRLSFLFGKFHTSPKASLLKNFPTAISNTILLSTTNVIFGTIAYFFVRHIIYDVIFFILGLFITLNQNYPSFNVSLGFFIKVNIIAIIVVFSWEVLNYAFDAFLSIGCLHRGVPISELSTDPLGTLLTGLKSEKPFTRLTAFQELAYISKISEKEGRLAIYNRNHRREYIWADILKEIEKVLKENNSRINTVLLNSITSQQTSYLTFKKNENSIFGREYYTDQQSEYDYAQFAKPVHQNDPLSIFDSHTINIVIQNLKQAIELAKLYHKKFIESGFGIPFRYTIRREAERLSPTPVIVANAIIALSLLTRHAYDEDVKGTVSSTLGEVLEILEKSVSTCGKFIQNPSDYLVEKDEENVISLLHELSLDGFYEVTIKYSDVLKDVVLSIDAAHLVNWILDVAYKEELADQELLRS